MLVNFATAFDRAHFLQQLLKSAPDVFELARPSAAQPTTVSFRGLTEPQERWLNERVDAFEGAKIFEDVRFQSLQRA
ncbi:hypothetical protein [Methylopila sp. M107]|uniref:hypothetical protein n=1 Tax=Methylopila sp. M107 TaxID=1101190 RepID=UPI00039F0FB3|nr:hypothetical protein [Methylopila sp. M107]